MHIQNALIMSRTKKRMGLRTPWLLVITPFEVVPTKAKKVVVPLSSMNAELGDICPVSTHIFAGRKLFYVPREATSDSITLFQRDP